MPTADQQRLKDGEGLADLGFGERMCIYAHIHRSLWHRSIA